jgi:hypothetical protein
MYHQRNRSKVHSVSRAHVRSALERRLLRQRVPDPRYGWRGSGFKELIDVIDPWIIFVPPSPACVGLAVVCLE